MGYWLLSQSALQELQASVRRLVFDESMRQAFVLFMQEPESSDRNRSLKVAGGVGEIAIEGVLTEGRGLYSFMFGGTTYGAIRAALADAAQDPAIKSVVLNVNSPGGNVDGLFETLDALKAFPKPISVTAKRALSAAYGLASVAGPVVAKHRSAEFGSVGVAVTYFSFADEVAIDITSTDAPDKRPDPKTPEGKAVIQKELDAIAEMFMKAIADGRSAWSAPTTVDDVRQTFGRGAVLFAAEAKSARMIDKLPKEQGYGRATKASNDEEAAPVATQEPPADSQSTATTAAGGEDEPMDINEFKAKHPQLFEQIQTEARTVGADGERKRVKAHLLMGEKSGDMKTAHEAIRAGTAHDDPETQAAYMMAAANRGDQTARTTETATAAAAVAAAAPAPGTAAAASATPAAEGGDLGDQVVAIFDKGRKPVSKK